MKNQINEEEKKKKRKKLLLLFLLLLLLLKVIIIYFHSWKKNADIFVVKEEDNIIVTNTTTQGNNTNTTNNIITDNYYDKDNSNNIINDTINESPTTPEDTQIKEFKVTSTGEKITEKLTIFDAVKYNGKAVIYPTISNTYCFEISNTLDFDLICKVSFNEQNLENIPIKYKLKENGIYIKGDKNTYVSYDELDFNNILNSKSENKYELEWKWLEGDDDNSYGDVNKTITYEIQLTVTAEQQTEE